MRALFMFFDPLQGWRRVSSREHRTRVDWALEIQQLVDVDYPKAELITLVCDNLNTHDIGSLYHTFDAETAHRLTRRLRIIHTPRNGSWLHVEPLTGEQFDMAEMELSVLTRQCINRRFESADQMEEEIKAWQEKRNQEKLGVSWRLTTKDARIKLKTLYPIHDK